ncbi:MAG: BlaI/MecI/CopY family transcriptional regulator [Clostridiales bacterium]|nr:MAG: BlaI/MecI/CopY family transcriptional regulator [Clostridiales bacterium]
METPKIFESEYRFCLILWDHEPIGSGELVKLCREELGWKPTTTYTVIKRLSQRGVLKNENSVVTSLISKEEAQASEIDELVEKRFEGSLPAFIAAFTKHRRMTESEINDIRKMIDDYGKENVHEPD